MVSKNCFLFAIKHLWQSDQYKSKNYERGGSYKVFSTTFTFQNIVKKIIVFDMTRSLQKRADYVDLVSGSQLLLRGPKVPRQSSSNLQKYSES